MIACNKAHETRMPKLIGALRAKDEEVFVWKTVEEACKYCDELAVIDDWSKDRTIEIINEICFENKIRCEIIRSPDERYHEGRDRDLLLGLVHQMKADWCLQIDADEIYENEFTKNINSYLDSNYDVIWIGATHMWSLYEQPWETVDTFRCDSNWSTSFLEDGVGIQHNRPALFRIFPEQKKSGSLRDHGYLCPKELWDSNKSYFPQKIFAHFGYSTPSLISKKCERHGSIPATTQEEINGVNYEPEWRPSDFNRDAAIQIFKNEWLRKDIELRKMTREIW